MCAVCVCAGCRFYCFSSWSSTFYWYHLFRLLSTLLFQTDFECVCVCAAKVRQELFFIAATSCFLQIAFCNDFSNYVCNVCSLAWLYSQVHLSSDFCRKNRSKVHKIEDTYQRSVMFSVKPFLLLHFQLLLLLVLLYITTVDSLLNVWLWYYLNRNVYLL